MSGTQVAVPLQVICQLMATGLVARNMTVSLIAKRAVAETTDAQVLPYGYVAFPELGFAYKGSTVMLSPNDARKMCLNEGGQLAVVDSTEKAEKILDHLANFPGWVGLGMGSIYGTSEWITIDGKSTNKLPWANGEPNGSGKCAMLSKNFRGLGNYDCSLNSYYFCEIALPRN